MTKNKDRKPDGYVEVIQSTYSGCQKCYFQRTPADLKSAVSETLTYHNIKTVAIGRIYLKNPNPST